MDIYFLSNIFWLNQVEEHPYNGKSKDGKLSTLHEDTRGEAMGTEDMEISNSPQFLYRKMS